MTKKTSTDSATADASSPATYETAVARLEKIVDEMNSGSVPLDAAIKLYEEGDNLLRFCSKVLSDAQQKIETLVKDRQGELTLNAAGKPVTQEINLVSNGNATYQPL